MKNITKLKRNQLSEFSKIFVLVSGGIDSTYLFELLKAEYPTKVIPVNCFNPLENNPTLKEISMHPDFIRIESELKESALEVVTKAFYRIPALKEKLDKTGKWSKHDLGCCKKLKTNAFKKNPIFKSKNSVVISGIKAGDGKQRQLFLSQLRKGNLFIGRSKHPNNYMLTEKVNRKLEIMDYCKGFPTIFHRHTTGILYCYPFRDYQYADLPYEIIVELKDIYPDLSHSHCKFCPIPIIHDKKQSENYESSLAYWEKLQKREKKWQVWADTVISKMEIQYDKTRDACKNIHLELHEDRIMRICKHSKNHHNKCTFKDCPLQK